MEKVSLGLGKDQGFRGNLGTAGIVKNELATYSVRRAATVESINTEEYLGSIGISSTSSVTFVHVPRVVVGEPPRTGVLDAHVDGTNSTHD